MVELGKWYLDLVTDLGAVLVGYAVDCRIGPASVRYASLLHASTDRPAPETPSVLSALVMARVYGAAMGIDVPRSNRRCSRLAAADSGSERN